MDSDRRLGIALTLLGVFALVQAVVTLTTATDMASHLMFAGFTVGGISISGVGIAILLGKVGTGEGGGSRWYDRKLNKREIAIAGVVVFVIDILLIIGLLMVVE